MFPKPERRGPKPRTRIKTNVPPPRRRSTDIARMIEQADERVRRIVRARNGGRCERCKVNVATDTAHGWPRDYFGTRWDLRNVFNLCRFCHDWLGKARVRMASFMVRMIGGAAYDDVQTKANAVTPVREPMLREIIENLDAVKREGLSSVHGNAHRQGSPRTRS